MQMMALSKDDPNYIGHIPCPQCGSKDNNYRWADGHEFCFGRCGYYKSVPLTKEEICVLLEQKEFHEFKASTGNSFPTLPEIPEDAYASILEPGLTWIKKYGIYNEEIREHDILWSQSQEQLIFPIYNDNYYTIAWQARNFRPNSKKYLTYGKMDEILHILGLTKHSNPDIILVEDLISAIKVSRYYRCLPLFGSACSKDKLSRIRRYTDHVRFWLDSDKLGSSIKMAKVAAQLGMKTSIIHTQKDPKETSPQDILQLGQA